MSKQELEEKLAEKDIEISYLKRQLSNYKEAAVNAILAINRISDLNISLPQ